LKVAAPEILFARHCHVAAGRIAKPRSEDQHIAARQPRGEKASGVGHEFLRVCAAAVKDNNERHIRPGDEEAAPVRDTRPLPDGLTPRARCAKDAA
jgi:hypothetical protein